MGDQWLKKLSCGRVEVVGEVGRVGVGEVNKGTICVGEKSAALQLPNSSFKTRQTLTRLWEKTLREPKVNWETSRNRVNFLRGRSSSAKVNL